MLNDVCVRNSIINLITLKNMIKNKKINNNGDIKFWNLNFLSK